MSQTLQSVLCITTNKYLVRVLVVLLQACFSVVSPIRFLLAAIFFSGHPYIGSTTVLPHRVHAFRAFSFIFLHMHKTYHHCNACDQSNGVDRWQLAFPCSQLVQVLM